jgi:hypothetical protein
VDAWHFNRQIPTPSVGVEAASKEGEITSEPGHFTE